MNQQNEDNLEQYYKDLYEREKAKNETLVYRLSDAQRQIEDLTRKLDKIKGSIFWKLAKPFTPESFDLDKLGLKIAGSAGEQQNV